MMLEMWWKMIIDACRFGREWMEFGAAMEPRIVGNRATAPSNLETLLTLSNGTANERDNDHGISNGESTVTAKRQRSVSPPLDYP